MKIGNEKLKDIYVLMKRCRVFEERALAELRKGMIAAGFHLSVGEEAIPCGICPFLEKEDYLITSHRGHHDLIARGARVDKMMAELFGRETGYCRGVGGSMHIAALDLNILGSLGIVGSGLPLSSGVALACKMKKWKRVTVCFFGDGASCTGAFHEALVFAAAFDLPVIFVLENNQYEESTNWKYWGWKMENLAQRAAGYGIPGVSVDGNDVEAVAAAAVEAIDRARGGKGPTLIEGVTFRIYGHHTGDSGDDYRSKEEIEAWKKKDPIDRVYSRLLEAKVITEKENQEIEAALLKEIDEAVQFAMDSPRIKPEEAFNNTVYFGRAVRLKKV